MGYPTLQEALLSMKTHGKYKIVWSKIKKNRLFCQKS